MRARSQFPSQSFTKRAWVTPRNTFVANGKIACGQTNIANSTNVLDLVTCERCLEIIRATRGTAHK